MSFDFLAGVRVLDLSQYLPGPFATQILSDLGADVVKVEPPTGDPLKALNPLTGAVLAPGTASPFYHSINAGKKVLRLDLKTDDGTRRFRDLVGEADVLVESYRPGVMDRLGLSPAILERVNPSLIHVSLTGFGQTGPLSSLAGHDVNYMAAAGALALNGGDRAPVVPTPPVADHASALTAVIGVLAALIKRGLSRESGMGKESGIRLGQYLDISMSDSVLAWQSWGLNGALDVRRGETLLGGGAACYQIYPCKDGGFLSVGALEPKFWRAFCIGVGRHDWVERHSNPLPQTAFIQEVADLLASEPLEHWVSLLAGVDACVFPLVTLENLADQPQVVERGLITKGGAGEMQVLFPLLIAGRTQGQRLPVRELAVGEPAFVTTS